LQQATVAPTSNHLDGARETAGQAAAAASAKTVNAFNFLRVAGHFFRGFEFEDYKVDNFVQDILELDSGFQKSDLHRCLIENLKITRDYRDHLMAETPDKTFSPYTSIRHCLYFCDQETFGRILSRGTRERFAGLLKASRGDSG
jgi:putative GTP pyrophosphokinase